jgi:hypothetical protein
MRDNEYMTPSFAVTGLTAQYNCVSNKKTKTGQDLLTESDIFLAQTSFSKTNHSGGTTYYVT